MGETINPLESKEWTAGPDEEIRIPENYILGLKYEILVLSSKKIFTFRCVDFHFENNICHFYRVIMDTSKRNAKGQVTLQRVSYHEYITLANVGFMAIPLPSEESPTPSD